MKEGAGLTAEYNPYEWRIRDSASEVLAHFHTDPDGHVTVTCHCARCEAEREAAREATREEPEPMTDGITSGPMDCLRGARG